MDGYEQFFGLLGGVGGVLMWLAVHGSQAADRAHWIFSVQWDFITGKVGASELDRIRGQRVNRSTAEADPEALKRIARVGINVPVSYREIVG